MSAVVCGIPADLYQASKEGKTIEVIDKVTEFMSNLHECLIIYKPYVIANLFDAYVLAMNIHNSYLKYDSDVPRTIYNTIDFTEIESAKHIKVDPQYSKIATIALIVINEKCRSPKISLLSKEHIEALKLFDSYPPSAKSKDSKALCKLLFMILNI